MYHIFFPTSIITMSKLLTILPIDKHKDEIITAIKENQVIVIAGDTGSGKTTRLPQYCLEVAQEGKLVGCTQPRRLAAVSVAARVGEEVGRSEEVGYKIRFHDYTTAKTKIKFMTDGVLLAETKSDRDLRKYSILIVDEAHERNLNIDFLLGYLKRLLPRRPDLKLIITSATIDTASFAKHFNNAPLISIEGRTFPIDLRYAPIADEDEDYLEHCTGVVSQLFLRERPADTLIFLPTEKDIRNCCEMLAKHIPNVEILPLFGRLQGSDQRRIFQPCPQGKIAKIVVATNVAETSITVPGIRYVIDSGLARMTYYSVRSKTTSLPIQKISRASCDQRKGRCGRVSSGTCIRLFAEEDYLGRDEFTLPEIKRSNLAEVLLQMSSLKLGDPNKFPFVDPPATSTIRDGYALLQELGAIKGYELTLRGKIMADLPIDPCISRILIEASSNSCLRETMIIAAALSVQDPRIRPAEKEKEADQVHQRFAHKHSDFMALLNIWNSFHEEEEKKSWSRLKKFCKSNFLSFQRMREWLDLHEQLCRIVKRYKEFSFNENDGSYEQIHRSILAGFLRNIALKKEKKIYMGAGNRELMVFPGSHLFQSAGQWIMAAGFLDTNRLYALTVATIEVDWIEPLAKSLCRYSWANPRWEKKTGQVIADEKVTLFGLVLLASRRVNFGKRDKKNRAEARRIFIESALLSGDLWGKYPFLKNNLTLVSQWQETEERLRKRDIVYSDTALHQFYQDRLGEDVYDRTSLEKFLKQTEDKKALFMTEQDILRRTPETSEYADFPTTIQIGSLSLKLSYTFDPRGNRDGLTVHIPVDLADTISPGRFDWLVPGFLKEKITFLLKGLPKSLRKKLVPINSSVDRIMDDISTKAQSPSGNMLSCLESSILKLYRFNLQRSDWPQELPHHLTPYFVLEADSGKEVCSGNNLKQMLTGTPNKGAISQEQFSLKKDAQIIVDKWKGWEGDSWAFDQLPASIPLYNKQGSISGFLFTVLDPIEQRSKVQVNFTRNKQEALQRNQKGLSYLYQLQFKGQLKPLRKSCSSALSAPSSLWLVKNYSDRKEASDHLLQFILQGIFDLSEATLPGKESFAKVIGEVQKMGLLQRGNLICQDIAEIFRLRRETAELLEKVFLTRKNANKEKETFSLLIEEILPKTFLQEKEIDLNSCRRQFRSLQVRLERFSANPVKDGQKNALLAPHLKNIEVAEKTREKLSDEACQLLDQYKKMVQEFRISVFSPEIKTQMPVSDKKLLQHWQKTKSFI
ncbi:ATP-dependent RNA helicase HrpA [Desulfotalea psychrophila]|uniref:Related to ATP-dependent helicase HrpA n=1 Tax=Desulfotalea psychrophila (strain LSv54 / DSM 12343) TaxID=177439 RepID=Q6AL39_DESPS|nr:ATP-dependent RNA helicase HrpA [Desulfotalea psychrophila]CAG36936.1 related to ATP-dependent helicase HrpA [Desulfotalea psychrophila LSv54]